uniref:STAC3-related SH3 domain-containing protein n=1 Tax=Strongyloides venezuelensis TaxID=75913 RepID=A0A0K0EVG1_STRVS
MFYDGRSVTKTYLPKSSISTVYKNETIMSVRKNICLSKESMALYCGQIIFVQNNSLSIDKKLTIRTETNKLVNCHLSFIIPRISAKKVVVMFNYSTIHNTSYIIYFNIYMILNSIT